jgi:DNA-binding XRE family transcriptional regulator/predicted RNase H-like HicB family nuclease
MQYVARLTKEGRRTLIEFPDCPGCQTFAEANEDILENAREALEGWLEARLVHGDAPSQPRARAVRDRRWLPVRVDPTLAVRLQLRWARQAAGISQAELARRVGVTRQAISLLESPDANLTLSTLVKVAQALGMELEIELQPKSSAA